MKRDILPDFLAGTLAAGAAVALAAAVHAQDGAAKPAAAGGKPYTVVDGYKVDANTMNGFRAWRAAACDRCHGAAQQGLVGPSLIESFKTIDKETFEKTVTEGRLEKGMPSFKASPTVMEHKDGLYAYLKGRSDGAITRVKVEELKQ
jgi:mono/diheme cytochrome c family protein